MRTNKIITGAAAAVALLIAAPGAAFADDIADAAPAETTTEQTVEETTETVVEVADETVTDEQEAAPADEAPATTPQDTTPAVDTVEPPAPKPQTKTLRWALPNGGTPDNVTWDQPVFDATLIPCGQSVWIQVDVYPYTTPQDQARTDALDDDGILKYGEDHGWAQSWSFEKYDAPACPPVVPPTPTATLDAACGIATVTMTNPQKAGTIGQTASFVVEVNGNFANAFAVVADGTETISYEFQEDSGDHTVEVFQAGISEWKSLGLADVTSDCVIPEEPETPTTPETPVDEAPAQAAVFTTPLEADGLAQTGADQNVMIVGLGVAGVLATLAALLFALSRRTFAVKGRETLER